MLKKIELIDKTKQWVRKELIYNMKSMQECIATCIEYLNIFKNEGEFRYKLAYNQLKTDRGYKSYFKSVKNARWILENVSYDNVDYYINLLKTIGITALQIKLKNMPLEAFESKKDIDRLMTTEENTLKYHPNVRCNELLKIFKNFNNEECMIENERLSLILMETESYENAVNNTKQFVLSLYSKSPLLDKIEKRISGFKAMEIPLEKHNESLVIYPSNLNIDRRITYNQEVVSLNEIEEFIMVKSDSFFYISNRVAALEAFHFIGYLDYKSKNIKIVRLLDPTSISKLIKISQVPTVFLEKKRFVDYKSILDEDIINKTIYIYMESAIIYNIEFIREHFSGGIYTFINFDKVYLMCIKKDNYIIIQPISKRAINTIKAFINTRSIQISYREWIVSGLINLEKEIYDTNKYQQEYINFSLKNIGDL